MPPALATWDDYEAKLERAMTAGEVPDYTYVCWELRPHPRLGTLEVRVMDAQPSLARAAGLAALVQGLARHAAEHPDSDDLPEEYVLDNDFRACRHGLEGVVIDGSGRSRPMRDHAAEMLHDARASLAPDRADGPLDEIEALLAKTTEYAHQRELFARGGIVGLLGDLARRTSDLGG
jgi:carboxylate-amine ligase